MFGKHGTVWQIALAAFGLVIVAVVLIGPRGHQATSLVTAPAADVAANGTQGARAVVQRPAAQQQAADQPSGGAAAPSDGSAGQPAAPASAAATSSGSGAAAVPSLPAAPAVSGAGRTLFLDDFTSDPLGALPTGWLLADPTSSSSGLGGVPILGALLGGLTQSGGGGVAPAIVNDRTHVLSRPAGSWSHIAAGPMTVDSTATASVRMLDQGSGFVGVTGRFQDVSDSLMCGLNGGSVLQLWQIVGGRQQLLASTPVAAAPNVFHTISMAMQGGQMSCSVDGSSTLHATGTWTSPGRVGLVALGNVTSEFDDVVATALS